MGGYQYLTYLQPTGEKSTKTIDYVGVPLTCNAGDKSKLKIYYIEMPQDKVDQVGQVLATAETAEFDCLNTV